MSKAEPIHVRLRRRRLEVRMTAKAVAGLIGVPESTYREWEYGRGMKLPPIQKISQVLAISVTELITGEKPSLIHLLEELESIENKLHEMRSGLGSLI